MSIDQTPTYDRILRSRFISANIPLPYAGNYLDDVTDSLATQEPSGAVETWLGWVRNGNCLRAQGRNTRSGMGLWISGHRSTLVAAAITQQLLLDQHIESALFVDAYEYADSCRPGRDNEYAERIQSDLVVLTGVSRLKVSTTAWAPELVYQVTRQRYWNGLPTIISDTELLLDNAQIVLVDAFVPIRLGKVVDG